MLSCYLDSRRRGPVWLLAWALALLPAERVLGAGGAGGDARDPQRLLANLPDPAVACSARIVDLDSGQALAAVGSTVPLLPASTAKVFVLAAAIDVLGPDFAFRTVLVRRGPDLVLIGDGDPALGDLKVAEARGVSQDAALGHWAQALLSQGVTTIAGDLVIDDSLFDGAFIHPDWEPGDVKKWFAAPVGALNYNGNCIDVTIEPAAEAGAPVRWETVPRTDLIEVVNRCKSGGKGTPLIDRPQADFRFVISGRCPKRWPFPPVPVADPGLLAGGALRTALADHGIAIVGQIRRERVRTAGGQLPPECQVVGEWVTPLPLVLARAGKDSQNMFAECLLKRLGYEWSRRQGHADPQGTWATGRSAVEEFLVRAGADPNRVTLADGSGLSRSNRCSADDLVAVLAYMYRHPQRDLYCNSLSSAGSDGTLRKRLTGLPGQVYAKTGYLSGTRTLSGYAVTPQGRWRAFAVLFNGFKGGAAPYNTIHDEICRMLAADPPAAPGSSGEVSAAR